MEWKYLCYDGREVMYVVDLQYGSVEVVGIITSVG